MSALFSIGFLYRLERFRLGQLLFQIRITGLQQREDVVRCFLGAVAVFAVQKRLFAVGLQKRGACKELFDLVCHLFCIKQLYRASDIFLVILADVMLNIGCVLGDDRGNAEEGGLGNDVAALAAEKIRCGNHLQNVLRKALGVEGDALSRFQGLEIFIQLLVFAANGNEVDGHISFNKDLTDLLHTANAVAALYQNDGEFILIPAERAAVFLFVQGNRKGFLE